MNESVHMLCGSSDHLDAFGFYAWWSTALLYHATARAPVMCFTSPFHIWALLGIFHCFPTVSELPSSRSWRVRCRWTVCVIGACAGVCSEQAER